MKINYFLQYKQQRGYILASGLLLLVIIMFIGLTAKQTTLLETKMAGNAQDHEIALQAAESAVQQAIKWLNDGVNGAGQWSLASTATISAMPGVYVLAPTARPWSNSATGGGCAPQSNWTCDAGSSQIPAADVYGAAGQTQPRYMIEYYPTTDPEQFRITGLGYGLSNDTQVMVQVVYQFN